MPGDAVSNGGDPNKAAGDAARGDMPLVDRDIEGSSKTASLWVGWLDTVVDTIAMTRATVT